MDLQAFLAAERARCDRSNRLDVFACVGHSAAPLMTSGSMIAPISRIFATFLESLPVNHRICRRSGLFVTVSNQNPATHQLVTVRCVNARILSQRRASLN